MLVRIRRLLGVWLMMIIWASCASATGLQEELSRCAVISDDQARLVCYDELTSRMQQLMERWAGESTQKQLLTGESSQMEKPFEQVSMISDRQLEDQRRGHWLGIQPYRRNYILPLTYNENDNDQLSDETQSDYRSEDVEIKFQVSFELPVWKSILEQDLDLYFAYTQLSFFQAYNEEYSSPFRDTVYEPEIGFNWQPDLTLMDWRLKSARVALNHQSNGRTEPLSRSWNRLIGQLEVEQGNLGLGLRLWHRFQEDEEDDDNPDISDFLGYGELFAGYDIGPHRFGLMLRNLLDHGAVQIGWSRLLNERVRFYVQYFNGYGESLIDYDQQVNRLGIGFLLNEWP